MVDLEFCPVEENVANNLESVPHLGEATDAPPNDQRKFRACVHDRPVALSLKNLLTRGKISITAKLYNRFDLWLVPHRFSVFRESGSSTIIQTGCDVEYLNEGQTISIISLIPAAEFVDRFGASLDVETKVNVNLEETGILQIGSTPFTDGALIPVHGSAQMSASLKVVGDGKINLSLRVATPFISAIGIGSTKCSFQFTAAREPLFNRDIETWAIVALPKHAEDLGYRMRCSYISRRLFAPRSWQTPWTEIRAIKAS